MRFATILLPGGSGSTNERPMTIEAKVGKERTRIITVPADSPAAESARDADRSGKEVKTTIGEHRVIIFGRVF